MVDQCDKANFRDLGAGGSSSCKVPCWKCQTEGNFWTPHDHCGGTCSCRSGVRLGSSGHFREVHGSDKNGCKEVPPMAAAGRTHRLLPGLAEAAVLSRYLRTSHYELGLLQSCHFDCYLEAARSQMTNPETALSYCPLYFHFRPSLWCF